MLARAQGLPLVQRTAATLVTLILSLCVLVLLAAPLTWRRITLVGSVLAVASLGAAALAGFWVLSRRRGRGQQPRSSKKGPSVTEPLGDDRRLPTSEAVKQCRARGCDQETHEASGAVRRVCKPPSP